MMSSRIGKNRQRSSSNHLLTPTNLCGQPVSSSSSWLTGQRDPTTSGTTIFKELQLIPIHTKCYLAAARCETDTKPGLIYPLTPGCGSFASEEILH
uniref:Uncharacterized protein n=1 Tax=Ditylenchus dipsaci TaxID=166011 RepID=A0A915EMT1_9BILA